MPIRSFGDRATQEFFETGRLKKGAGWTGIKKVVARKLDMIHYAAVLADLRVPPNNRLEALKGDLDGYYSIRVNDQWRVIFTWSEQGASEVQVVDYHD